MKIKGLKSNIEMEEVFENEENVKLIKTWVDYLNNGHYGSSRDIVDMYNKVFNGIKQKQPYTNCGSCLRRCVVQMNNALEDYLKKKEIVEPLKEIDELMSEDDDEVQISTETKRKTRKK